MKKKYLLFILCLLISLCINIDGVKALNTRDDARTYEDTTICYYKGTLDGSLIGVEVNYRCPQSGCYLYYNASESSDPSHEYDKVTFVNDDVFSENGHFYNNGTAASCPASIWIYKNVQGGHFVYYSAHASRNAGTTYAELSLTPGGSLESDFPVDSSTADVKDITTWAQSDDSIYGDIDPNDACSVIDDDIKDLLNLFFLIISVAGIIILIAMTIFNLMGVITSHEDDALSNFFKHLKVRLISLVILLLLPVLVSSIINIVNRLGDIWGVNSDNPVCNITATNDASSNSSSSSSTNDASSNSSSSSSSSNSSRKGQEDKLVDGRQKQ